MTRIHLAAAFLLSIAGLAALAPHPALARARSTAVQPMSPAAVDGAEVTDGVATAWLRGAPQPAKGCPQGLMCCELGLPQVCLRCAPHC